ncbi:type II secretion system protein [Bacillus aquiflavi]|uniref:Type II secretion system protein n=1 Tax=Bacillus aquiflavi TaxID=2672567 RepID=A0A6B3VPE8_9BACI|nr:competence type IV pilus minor pilin ComGD [Bacillus aquiflavi]MBA4535804.1 type II secretion system protein [Bacillus aquiflavi]NEY80180.1 type II secretion system protein [Bacillus aquiflavi]
MINKIQRSAGFTLVETLFVLSVFFMIASITVFLLKPHFTKIEKEFFFSNLAADLYYAQIYAIAHQSEVTVNFLPDQQFYYFRSRHHQRHLLKRTYSKEILIYEGSINLNFRFLADGNINKFGSFFIRIHDNRYKLTFLLGKGRFYVVKER